MKIHKTKCPFCKERKEDVIWNFAGEIGYKGCADKYFDEMLRGTI